jgi:N-acetylmuramic acid 6-phosphate etherase
MILIGIDAGGTRTRVAVWRDGVRLDTVTGPGTALRPGRGMTAGTSMAGLARTLLPGLGVRRADVLVVGAAGAGRTDDANDLRAALRGEYLADRVVITTDAELALAAFEPPAGVVVLAGTGSVAMARGPDGRTTQRGGLGWQMGDEGGGYWIGRRALDAVGRAHDGRGPATGLTAALLRVTRSDGFRNLVGWAANATVREVAGLAATVVEAAIDGDEAAARILDRGGRELAELVRDLAESLEVRPLPLGLGGGLLAEGGPVRAALVAALGEGGLPVIPIGLEPLAGAPRLADRR